MTRENAKALVEAHATLDKARKAMEEFNSMAYNHELARGMLMMEDGRSYFVTVPDHVVFDALDRAIDLATIEVLRLGGEV